MSTQLLDNALLARAKARSVVAGLLLAIILGGLDKTIVVVALPSMGTELGRFDLLAWVVSAYLVAVTVATPIYGKLSDLYGRRVMLSCAIGVFVLASVWCAVAQSMPMLIAARVLLGLGGGGLIAIAQSAIADMVSPRERGRYQGYISATYAVASVAGPVLGGFLTHNFSWRWVFWINLPLGLLAFFISRRALADLPIPNVKREIDYLGAGLFVAAVLPFLIGVARAGQGTPWLDEVNIKLFSAAVVLSAAFLWQERRAVEPLIPLQLFRIATFTLCCLTVSVAFFLVMALSVFVPLRLQMGTDVGVAGAAILLVPFTLAIPVGTYISGRVMVSTGRFKPALVAGAAIVPIALFGLSFSDQRDAIMNGSLLVLAGIGAGLQFPSSLVAVQNAVPGRHTGIATAATIFFRSLAAAIGIAVLTAILFETIRENAPAVASSFRGASILSDVSSGAVAKLDAASRIQLGNAVATAFRKIFVISTVIALAALSLALAVPNNRLEDGLR